MRLSRARLSGLSGLFEEFQRDPYSKRSVGHRVRTSGISPELSGLWGACQFRRVCSKRAWERHGARTSALSCRDRSGDHPVRTNGPGSVRCARLPDNSSCWSNIAFRSDCTGSGSGKTQETCLRSCRLSYGLSEDKCSLLEKADRSRRRDLDRAQIERSCGRSCVEQRKLIPYDR